MTKIIAEIGWNHMGDMSLAEDMIIAAASSGASFAKFQTWSVSRLHDGEWDTDGRREIYNKAELTAEQHAHLINICQKHNISFLSSAFSIPDADLLKSLNQTCIKIPSFEVANSSLIRYCMDSFQHVIISTGTATATEIDHLSSLVDHERTTIMHCVSSYPCSIEQANLPRINYLNRMFKLVGYSDHVPGINASIYSLRFSPVLIEKHFTLDHELPGRDNKFAILPDEMSSLHSHISEFMLANVDLGVDYQPSESLQEIL